ncbi:hypothetical protein PQR34_43995 [Paraburkholderia sediminicola]|uniref:hypothetical protein n=1 Tax=Paraburkholderia sediminicola TaxID=458836 RepID=UPI0038BD8886
MTESRYDATDLGALLVMIADVARAENWPYPARRAAARVVREPWFSIDSEYATIQELWRTACRENGAGFAMRDAVALCNEMRARCRRTERAARRKAAAKPTKPTRTETP